MASATSLKRSSPSTALPASKRTTAPASASCSHTIRAFEAFRDEIDQHNDRRETLIKASRDATSLSKKLIFHLHRNGSRADTLTKQAEIVSLLRNVAAKQGLADPATRARYERNLGPGIEEFIEAVAFAHYLETGNVVTRLDVHRLVNPPDSPEVVPITPARFLLGLSDVTGELMRHATNNVAQPGKVQSVLLTLRAIRDQIDPLVPLVRDLNKKQAVTRQSVRKIEDLAYAIAVRASEFQSDPQALQEMVRRTLDSGGSGEQRDHDADN